MKERKKVAFYENIQVVLEMIYQEKERERERKKIGRRIDNK